MYFCLSFMTFSLRYCHFCADFSFLKTLLYSYFTLLMNFFWKTATNFHTQTVHTCRQTLTRPLYSLLCVTFHCSHWLSSDACSRWPRAEAASSNNTQTHCNILKEQQRTKPHVLHAPNQDSNTCIRLLLRGQD